jgi:PAS domain S-box-containing protein
MMSDLLSAIAVLDKAVDVVCVVDAKENIVSVNSAAERLWGLAPKELVGTWFGSLVAPEDGPVALRAMKHAVHGNQVAPFECRVLRNDGEQVMMLWTVNYRAEDNQLLCFAHDISQRKATELNLRLSEARSRFVVESMPMGLLITNAAGIIELANPAVEVMFGISLGSMIGQNIQQVVFSASDSEADTRLIARIAAARAIQIQAQRADGTPFPLEITVNEFQSLSGMSYIITMDDVSERHGIEKLKRELVSQISHDLGGPLTSVQGVLALLEDGVFGELDSDGAEAVTLANSEITRVISLIDGLVGVTKSTFGSNQIKLESVFFSEILVAALEKVMWAADANGTVFVTPEFNPQLHLDVSRFSSVLITFLTRAIEASTHGGTVEISVQESYRRFAVIRIRSLNVAPARPKQALQRDVDETIQERRSVLGVALCRSAIEHHGGTLDVCDEERADYVLTLPIAR